MLGLRIKDRFEDEKEIAKGGIFEMILMHSEWYKGLPIRWPPALLHYVVNGHNVLPHLANMKPQPAWSLCVRSPSLKVLTST